MYGLVPLSPSAGSFEQIPAMLAFAAAPLAHLRPLDIAVIAIYFGMVIWIGFYLKGQANTSEEFFMKRLVISDGRAIITQISKTNFGVGEIFGRRQLSSTPESLCGSF